MSWVAVGVAGVGAAVSIGTSISNRKRAEKALAEINKTTQPEYQEDPRLTEAYNRAEAMTKYGFAPEEKAQFQNQLARGQNAQRQSALDLGGGNTASAINSVLQANQTNAINQFAAQDAGLRRENIRYADSLAGQVQSQQNLIQQQKIARRQMLESAYGGAIAQQNQNQYQAMGDLTNIGVAAAGTSGRQKSPYEQETVIDYSTTSGNKTTTGTEEIIRGGYGSW